METGNLYIPRVREEDGGTYECQASNRFGTARLPVVLVIGGKLSGHGSILFSLTHLSVESCKKVRPNGSRNEKTTQWCDFHAV